MPEDAWVVLFVRVRPAVHKRIAEVAAVNDRSMSWWVNKHFSEYFEELDACTTQPSSTDS